MATYSLIDLLSRWAKGQLTLDQAIGHILQHLIALEKRLRALEMKA